MRGYGDISADRVSSWCRLWNLTSDNLSAICRDNPKRQKVETLREFLDPVLEDMDPENDIEDQYRVSQLPRLMSSTSHICLGATRQDAHVSKDAQYLAACRGSTRRCTSGKPCATWPVAAYMR